MAINRAIVDRLETSERVGSLIIDADALCLLLTLVAK
jgi:hypothetical protein